MPRQDLDVWMREQRDRRSRDVTHNVPRYADPETELLELLWAVAEESLLWELGTFVFQAEDAIARHPALLGIDRADADHRLMLATAVAMRRHKRHPATFRILSPALESELQATMREAFPW